MMSAASKKIFSHIGICLVFLLGLAACRRDDNPAPGGGNGSTPAQPESIVGYRLNDQTGVYIKNDSIKWFGSDSLYIYANMSTVPTLAWVIKFTRDQGRISYISSQSVRNGLRSNDALMKFLHTDGIVTYLEQEVYSANIRTSYKIDLDSTLRSGKLSTTGVSQSPGTSAFYFFRPDRKFSHRLDYVNGSLAPDTVIKITYNQSGNPQTLKVAFNPRLIEYNEMTYTDPEVLRLSKMLDFYPENPFTWSIYPLFADVVKTHRGGVLESESTRRVITLDSRKKSLVRENQFYGSSPRIEKDSLVFHF